MTSRMVAEWFEVSGDVIRDNIRRNRRVLEKHGLKKLSFKEIETLVSNKKEFNDLRVSRQGTNVFEPQTILMVSVMLAGSLKAHNIRRAMVKSNNSEIIKLLTRSNDRILYKQRTMLSYLTEVFEDIFSIKSEVFYKGYYIDIVVSSKYKELVVEIDEFGHAHYNEQEELYREMVLLEKYDALIRHNPDDENDNVFQLINKIIKEMEN